MQGTNQVPLSSSLIVERPECMAYSLPIAVTVCAWGYFHGFALAGLQIRCSTAAQKSRCHRDHGFYAGAGYWGDYGHFQRCLRRVVEAAAVCRFQPDYGCVRGSFGRPLVATCGPELRRLSRSKPQLRGDCEIQ